MLLYLLDHGPPILAPFLHGVRISNKHHDVSCSSDGNVQSPLIVHKADLVILVGSHAVENYDVLLFALEAVHSAEWLFNMKTG